MDNEINNLREILHKERLTTLILLEDVEEMIEVLSSEIPLESSTRQTVEEYLPALRAAISSLHERLNLSESDDPQPNDSHGA
jgi:hypothetical protein